MERLTWDTAAQAEQTTVVARITTPNPRAVRRPCPPLKIATICIRARALTEAQKRTAQEAGASGDNGCEWVVIDDRDQNTTLPNYAAVVQHVAHAIVDRSPEAVEALVLEEEERASAVALPEGERLFDAQHDGPGRRSLVIRTDDGLFRFVLVTCENTLIESRHANLADAIGALVEQFAEDNLGDDTTPECPSEAQWNGAIGSVSVGGAPGTDRFARNLERSILDLDSFRRWVEARRSELNTAERPVTVLLDNRDVGDDWALILIERCAGKPDVHRYLWILSDGYVAHDERYGSRAEAFCAFARTFCTDNLDGAGAACRLSRIDGSPIVEDEHQDPAPDTSACTQLPGARVRIASSGAGCAIVLDVDLGDGWTFCAETIAPEHRSTETDVFASELFAPDELRIWGESGATEFHKDADDLHAAFGRALADARRR